MKKISFLKEKRMLNTWIFLSMVLFGVVYFLVRRQRMTWVCSKRTGKWYFVKNVEQKQDVADLLAMLELRLHVFIEKASDLAPEDVRLLNIRQRWSGTLCEVENGKEAAYSLGKNALHLCVREQNGSLTSNINALMFILFHELAHIATDDIGHTPTFWKNMTWVLELAHKTETYDADDHSPETTTVCGQALGESPLMCSKSGTCKTELVQ